jgi:hemolysin
MTRNPLFFAIAVGVMLAALPTAFAYSDTTDKSATASTVAPANVPAIRMLSLSEVSTAFRQGLTVPPAYVGKPALRGVPLADQVERAPNGETLVGLVDAGALSSQAALAQVWALYDAGMPVLIHHGETEERNGLKGPAAIFGMASDAPFVYYYRGVTGELRMLSIPRDVDNPGAVTRTIAEVNARLMEEMTWIDEARSSAARIRTSGILAMQRVTADFPVEMPRLRAVNSAFNDGSSVTQEVDVIRDSTISSDTRKIITKTSYSIKPKLNGVVNKNFVVVPEYYTLTEKVTFKNLPSHTAASLINQYPQSNGSTDISFTDTQKQTTSFGFNISSDLEKGLKDSVPEASAKLGFGFNFGKTNTTEKSMSMVLKDYWVGSSSSRDGSSYSAVWRLSLADRIRGNSKFFHGSGNASEANMTPMMRQASPETFAAWQIRGGHDDEIRIEVRPSLMNLLFANKYTTPGQDPAVLPVSTVVVPANSPFLTREITVQIQSQEGAGRCLQTGSGATVSLGACLPPQTSFAQQWNLDADNRYKSRANGRCLQVNTSSGAITTETCSLALNQRWDWSAQAINSRYDGGDPSWRLYVSNGAVSAKIDPSFHQVLPDNPFHALLRPWSNYPLAPLAGSFVPNLGGGTPPLVPVEWVSRLRDVGAAERWSINIIRQVD